MDFERPPTPPPPMDPPPLDRSSEAPTYPPRGPVRASTAGIGTCDTTPTAKGGPRLAPTWNFLTSPMVRAGDRLPVGGGPTWNFLPGGSGQPAGGPTVNNTRPGTLDGPTAPTKKEKKKKKKSRAIVLMEVWTGKCNLVKRYVEEQGTLPAQLSTIEDDDGAIVNVGVWLRNQRYVYKKLSPEQQAQLKAIDGLKHVPRGRKKAKTTGDEEEEAGGSSSGSSSDGEEEEEAPSTGGAGAVGGYHNAAGFANLQGI